MYRGLGEPEGQRPLRRPKHRWEDNIKIDRNDVGCGCVDLIELAQVRDRWRELVNSVLNFVFHKMRSIDWLKTG